MNPLLLTDDLLVKMQYTPNPRRKNSSITERNSRARFIRINRAKLPEDFFNPAPTVDMLSKRLRTIKE
jgi:hypothetical protein